MCMAAKKKRIFNQRQILRDFRLTGIFFKTMTTLHLPPINIALLLLLLFFLATDRSNLGVIYCYFVTNVLHLINICLIYSDLSLNMDQCYICVVLPYMRYIVVLLFQKRYFERFGRTLSSLQTVNPIHLP